MARRGIVRTAVPLPGWPIREEREVEIDDTVIRRAAEGLVEVLAVFGDPEPEIVVDPGWDDHVPELD